MNIFFLWGSCLEVLERWVWCCWTRPQALCQQGSAWPSSERRPRSGANILWFCLSLTQSLRKGDKKDFFLLLRGKWPRCLAMPAEFTHTPKLRCRSDRESMPLRGTIHLTLDVVSLEASRSFHLNHYNIIVFKFCQGRPHFLPCFISLPPLQTHSSMKVV